MPLPPQWLSSHPVGGQGVRYLEDLITHSGYNRYAYEGVPRHLSVQGRVKQILQKKEAEDEKKRKRK